MGKHIDKKLYFSYTLVMKTAISIPDDVYRDAEITAKQLGLARSQLYVKAIKEFIEKHDRDKVTEKLNELFSAEDSKKSHIVDAGLDSMRKATRHDSW